jgi:hypothetical protein
MSEQEKLLKEMISHQQKTNQLLLILIETLLDEEDAESVITKNYMDGTPIG